MLDIIKTVPGKYAFLKYFYGKLLGTPPKIAKKCKWGVTVFQVTFHDEKLLVMSTNCTKFFVLLTMVPILLKFLRTSIAFNKHDKKSYQITRHILEKRKVTNHELELVIMTRKSQYLLDT